MSKKLLIVESPAKAKTIEKILGKDFEVKSSFGHIRDLDKEGMGIDIDNQFMPKYIVSDDKKKVVADLRAKAQKVDEVWLATDEDREGEAISWHLCEVLGLRPETTKRIVFHEITKQAIQKAVQQPRLVDMNLVNAQQARRILDRLVGFEVSPVLWRKLSGGNSLSAGRVQSVAVRLIVEREREINQFLSISEFRTEAIFEANDIAGKKVSFKAEGNKYKEEKDAKLFLDKCLNADFTVTNIQVKPGKRTPAAPFTTSTLQQEASRKLGMSVSRTMRVAQTLYENGYITYMRTDSVNLSQTALQNAEEVITKQYGKEYHQLRQYKNKNQSAQEAHEAIRPTDMQVIDISIPEGQKLYDLIRKRTLASQMADARLEKTVANISISTTPEELIATGEVIKFEGFLKVYIEGKDEEDENDNTGMLPPLTAGQKLPLIVMKATQRFSRPAPRYTEASLVKKLEELGIGRPSTYAPTISTIQQRNYIERKDKDGWLRNYKQLTLKDDSIREETLTETTGAEKGKLFPTDLGMVVTDFLSEHFTQIMDYGFTAKIENQFDEIAAGNKVWHEMIERFYDPFHKQVESTMENAERAKGEKELGTDPESGKPVIARLGRFGPMVQIGSSELDKENLKFASLKPNQSIETITLTEALELFKLPFKLEDYQDKEVSVGLGRFGPYVKWGDVYISIPKGEDPLTINQEKAITLIREKQEADAPIANYKGHSVTKGKGRFGPFIKWNELYVNVPKAYNFDNLSQKDIQELIDKKVDKEANRYIHQWNEEQITVENGRWGPFIRFGKQMLKLGKTPDGEKYTSENATTLTLEEVKKMIVEQVPDAFEKKKNSKKSTAKKTLAKKVPVTRKATTKK